jgi:hypothetical protein
MKRRKRCRIKGCLDMHCMYPGHGWFCLNKYINFPYVIGGRWYCKKHFEQANGSELSPEQWRRLVNHPNPRWD